MSLAPTAVELRMMPDPMMPLSAVIEEVQSEAYGISTFSMAFLNTAQSATYHFAPGQFNMLHPK